MMEFNRVICVLRDPRSLAIRYVGVTQQQLNKRLQAHLSERRTGYCSKHKKEWLNELDSCNLTPIIELLEVVPQDRSKECEEAWIRFLWECGCNLVNNNFGFLQHSRA